MRRSTSRLLFALPLAITLGIVGACATYLGYPAWRDTPVLQTLAADPSFATAFSHLHVSGDDVERAPWQAGLRVHSALLSQTLKFRAGHAVLLGSGWVSASSDQSQFAPGTPLTAWQTFDMHLDCRQDSIAQRLTWLKWPTGEQAQAWATAPDRTADVWVPGTTESHVLLASGSNLTTWSRHSRPWWVPSKLSAHQGQDISTGVTATLQDWAVACRPNLPAAALAAMTLNRWDKMPPVGYWPVRKEFRGKETPVLEGQSVLASIAGASRWQLLRTQSGGTALRWQFDELDSARMAWMKLRKDLKPAGPPTEASWRMAGDESDIRSLRWTASDTQGAALDLRLTPAENRWLVEVVWSESLVLTVGARPR